MYCVSSHIDSDRSYVKVQYDSGGWTFKANEIAKVVDISDAGVQYILLEDLSMRKFCAK